MSAGGMGRPMGGGTDKPFSMPNMAGFGAPYQQKTSHTGIHGMQKFADDQRYPGMPRPNTPDDQRYPGQQFSQFSTRPMGMPNDNPMAAFNRPMEDPAMARMQQAQNRLGQRMTGPNYGGTYGGQTPPPYAAPKPAEFPGGNPMNPGGMYSYNGMPGINIDSAIMGPQYLAGMGLNPHQIANRMYAGTPYDMTGFSLPWSAFGK